MQQQVMNQDCSLFFETKKSNQTRNFSKRKKKKRKKEPTKTPPQYEEVKRGILFLFVSSWLLHSSFFL